MVDPLWVMMMTAFIAKKSGVVPLIEGLGAQILDFRFEIISGLRSHLLLFFVEKKSVQGKKQLVQDLILPPSIYIIMCTLYTYTSTYMPRFSPSGFFGPSRCLIPTPGLTPEYPICAVCDDDDCFYHHRVCVRIHTPTPIYTPTCVKNREDTDNTPIFPSVKNNPPTPSHKCPHTLVGPPHPRSPTLNQQTAHT